MPIINNENWMPFGIYAGQTVSVHTYWETMESLNDAPIEEHEVHVTFSEKIFAYEYKRHVAFVHYGVQNLEIFERTMAKQLYVVIPGHELEHVNFDLIHVQNFPRNTSFMIYVDSHKALQDMLLYAPDLISWANGNRTTLLLIVAIPLRKDVFLNLQYRPNIYCYFLSPEQPNIFRGIDWIESTV